MKPKDYAQYLKSEHWRELRQQALERAEHRCQLCYSPNGLDVHHRTYERVGRERLADLTVLCRTCHEKHHDRHTRRRMVLPRRKGVGEGL